jgi:hypothetical protein
MGSSILAIPRVNSKLATLNKFHFLKRNEIDDHRWNEVISQSFNSLPYAFAWYLDAVAEHWDALVLNDYEAVMPLVWLRKLGVKCIYQPYYCQQLGLFSAQPQAMGVHLGFLKATNEHFPYVNMNLNHSSAILVPALTLLPKTNLLLDLNRVYEDLQKSYSANQRRNIIKAGKKGLAFSETGELKMFQKFYLGNVNRQKENFKLKHEKIFISLSNELITSGKGSIFGAVDTEGRLMAAVLLIHHKNRLIGIINTSSAEGKKLGASHFVFDQVIQKFSSSDYVLDFEGSSIVSIARFYQGFGPREEVFYNYKNTILKRLGRRFG